MRQLFFSFDRINFSARPDVIGSNTVHILVEVEGASLTIPDADYTVPDSRTIVFADTPSGGVIGRVDIADDRTAPVLIRIEVIDIDVFSSPSLGVIERRIHWPYNPGDFRDTCAAFNISYTVTLGTPPAPPNPAAGDLFACRQGTDALHCSSTTAGDNIMHVEAHPVLPCTNLGPTIHRPTFPAGTPPAEHHGRGFTSLSGNPRLVKNPSCIPIVREADRAAAGDTSTIRLTYFRPNTLITTNFSWNAVSLADGGQVEIVGSNTGDEISVRGTRAGEAGLEISYNGSLVSVYRVLVAPLKIILCRATILHEGDMSTCPKVLVTGLPTSGAPAAADLDSIAARILEHINGANRMLIQLGILLRLDSDTTVTDGAVATATRGIFSAQVAAGASTNVASGSTVATTNYRPYVFNFVYVVNDYGGNLGVATHYPTAAPQATVTDSGTPSTSWIPHTGLRPDTDAGTVTMTLIRCYNTTRPADCWGMWVTDNNPTLNDFAGTIAHEFGHTLHLGHRVESATSRTFWDGLNHPPRENVMHFNAGTDEAQDFDIIQAKAIRLSALVQHY